MPGGDLLPLRYCLLMSSSASASTTVFLCLGNLNCSGLLQFRVEMVFRGNARGPISSAVSASNNALLSPDFALLLLLPPSPPPVCLLPVPLPWPPVLSQNSPHLQNSGPGQNQLHQSFLQLLQSLTLFFSGLSLQESPPSLLFLASALSMASITFIIISIFFSSLVLGFFLMLTS